MASASASAASAGVGLVCSARILVTIAVTCALSARPLPVTAALTSLGVWKCTSMSRLAAARAMTPPACAVPIAVFAFWLANTRSIATTSGRWVSIQCSTVSLMVEQPLVQRLIGRGAHDVDVQRDDLTAAAALDDRQPAARQPGVDAHHPHARLLRSIRTAVRYLNGPPPRRRAATHRPRAGRDPRVGRRRRM